MVAPFNSIFRKAVTNVARQEIPGPLTKVLLTGKASKKVPQEMLENYHHAHVSLDQRGLLDDVDANIKLKATMLRGEDRVSLRFRDDKGKLGGKYTMRLRQQGETPEQYLEDVIDKASNPADIKGGMYKTAPHKFDAYRKGLAAPKNTALLNNLPEGVKVEFKRQDLWGSLFNVGRKKAVITIPTEKGKKPIVHTLWKEPGNREGMDDFVNRVYRYANVTHENLLANQGKASAWGIQQQARVWEQRERQNLEHFEQRLQRTTEKYADDRENGQTVVGIKHQRQQNHLRQSQSEMARHFDELNADRTRLVPGRKSVPFDDALQGANDHVGSRYESFSELARARAQKVYDQLGDLSVPAQPQRPGTPPASPQNRAASPSRVSHEEHVRHDEHLDRGHESARRGSTPPPRTPEEHVRQDIDGRPEGARLIPPSAEGMVRLSNGREYSVVGNAPQSYQPARTLSPDQGAERARQPLEGRTISRAQLEARNGSRDHSPANQTHRDAEPRSMSTRQPQALPAGGDDVSRTQQRVHFAENADTHQSADSERGLAEDIFSDPRYNQAFGQVQSAHFPQVLSSNRQSTRVADSFGDMENQGQSPNVAERRRSLAQQGRGLMNQAWGNSGAAPQGTESRGGQFVRQASSASPQSRQELSSRGLVHSNSERTASPQSEERPVSQARRRFFPLVPEKGQLQPGSRSLQEATNEGFVTSERKPASQRRFFEEDSPAASVGHRESFWPENAASAQETRSSLRNAVRQEQNQLDGSQSRAAASWTENLEEKTSHPSTPVNRTGRPFRAGELDKEGFLRMLQSVPAQNGATSQLKSSGSPSAFRVVSAERKTPSPRSLQQQAVMSGLSNGMTDQPVSAQASLASLREKTPSPTRLDHANLGRPLMKGNRQQPTRPQWKEEEVVTEEHLSPVSHQPSLLDHQASSEWDLAKKLSNDTSRPIAFAGNTVSQTSDAAKTSAHQGSQRFSLDETVGDLQGSGRNSRSSSPKPEVLANGLPTPTGEAPPVYQPKQSAVADTSRSASPKQPPLQHFSREDNTRFIQLGEELRLARQQAEALRKQYSQSKLHGDQRLLAKLQEAEQKVASLQRQYDELGLSQPVVTAASQQEDDRTFGGRMLDFFMDGPRNKDTCWRV